MPQELMVRDVKKAVLIVQLQPRNCVLLQEKLVLHSASYHINTSANSAFYREQGYAFGVCHGSPVTLSLGSANLRRNRRTGGPRDLWAPILHPPEHQEGRCCHRRNRRFSCPWELQAPPVLLSPQHQAGPYCQRRFPRSWPHQRSRRRRRPSSSVRATTPPSPHQSPCRPPSSYAQAPPPSPHQSPRPPPWVQASPPQTQRGPRRPLSPPP